MLTGKDNMIVYEAINKKNGKRYIGQTINSFKKRKQQHLDSVKHNHGGCRLFRNALIKYGSDGFDWKIIDHAKTVEELNEKESFWIEFFKTTNRDKGYNLKGGGANAFLTEETKRAIGSAQVGELNHM